VRSVALFPRWQRLAQATEYGRVFARPVRSADLYFTVLARPSTCDNPRLGLAISKKVDKRAVARNRLKRLSREVFRCQELPAWDFVIMAKRKAPAVENKILIASLQRHFGRIARQAESEQHG
jgi:ribonuclease P protein component